MEATLSFHSVPLHWGVWAWQRWQGPPYPGAIHFLSHLCLLCSLSCVGVLTGSPLPCPPFPFLSKSATTWGFLFSWLM